MKKQVIYPKFIPRLFATTLDLLFLSVILTPIMNILSRYIFLYSFNQFFVDYGIDTSDRAAMETAVTMPEFGNYVTVSGFLAYIIILFIIHFLLMGVYFVGFWRKFGATPGKILLRMKIVNAEDYDMRPDTYRLIKRFLGYATAIIGLWSILISKQGQAMHDRIAHTVVIKR
jgi:hypothetical protein